jgi:hypothetical protein
VATGADRKLNGRIARDLDHATDVVVVGDPRDGGGSLVDPSVEDLSRCVVVVIRGSDNSPFERALQRADRCRRS